MCTSEQSNQLVDLAHETHGHSLISSNQVPQNYKFVSQHEFCRVLENMNNGFKCLFSLKDFRKGDVLIHFGQSKVVSEPNYLSVQIGDGQHIQLSPEFLQYTNHSCSPNMLFNTDSMTYECLKDIKAGDELRFFYPATEWEMAQPFSCICQQDNCIGIVGGASKTPRSILNKYKLTSYIENKLKQIEN